VLGLRECQSGVIMIGMALYNYLFLLYILLTLLGCCSRARMRFEMRKLFRGRCDYRRALALRTVHDTPRFRIERIAPVHGAAVVPDQHVTQLPLVAPSELRLGSVRPDIVEQRFGFFQRQSIDVQVRPPPLGGSSMECRILRPGDTALKELSECHTASPSPSPPMATPFSITVEMIAISAFARHARVRQRPQLNSVTAWCEPLANWNGFILR